MWDVGKESTAQRQLLVLGSRHGVDRNTITVAGTDLKMKIKSTVSDNIKFEMPARHQIKDTNQAVGFTKVEL